MKENKLLTFYKQILTLGGMQVDENNYVYSTLGDDELPVNIKVDGTLKRLVLPTKEILASNNWDNLIVFHPLNENMFLSRGESKVVETFRKAINYRFNIVLPMIFTSLMTLAASPAMHKKLTPEQLQWMVILKEVDEKTIFNFTKIMDTLPISNTNDNLVSIYLKKQGVINGEKYSRIGVISFPLYEELTKSNGTVRGVKVRKKDLETYIHFFRTVFPSIDDLNHYMVGSNSQLAPFTDSLLRVIWKIAEPINALVDLFYGNKSHLAKGEAKKVHEYCYFNDEWLELGSDLSRLEKDVRMIPIQDSSTDQVAPVQTPVQTTQTPVVQNTVPVQQPMVQNTPQVNKPVTMNEIREQQLRALNNQQTQQQQMLNNMGMVNPMQMQMMNNPLINPNAHMMQMNPMMYQQQMPRQGRLLGSGNPYAMVNGQIGVMPNQNVHYAQMNPNVVNGI